MLGLNVIYEKLKSRLQTLPYTLFYVYAKEGWDEVNVGRKAENDKKEKIISGLIKVAFAGVCAGVLEFTGKSFFNEIKGTFTTISPDAEASIYKEILISIPVVATAGLTYAVVAPF